MSISCSYGVLESLDVFGLAKDDESTSGKMATTTEPLTLIYAECAGEGLFKTAEYTAVFMEFAKTTCRDKTSCVIPLQNNSIFKTFSFYTAI